MLIALDIDDGLGFLGGLIALLFLAYFFAAGIRAIIRSAEADKKRNQRLKKLSKSINGSFSPKPMPVNVYFFKPFTGFIRSGEPFLLNTFDTKFKSRHGRVVVRMGDFRTVVTFQTRGRNVEQISEFSYALIDLPFNTKGRLLVRPEGIMDSVATNFGAQDFDFESSEFNRLYLIRGTSKKFAFDVLQPGMMALIMDTKPFPILIDERRCCITDASSRWTVDLFQEKLNWIKKFVDAFPAHLAST